jgi:hypothetical protein
MEDIGFVLHVVCRKTQSVATPATILKRVESSLLDLGINVAGLRQFDLKG